MSGQKQKLAITTSKIETGIREMVEQYLAQGMPPGRAAFTEGYQRASFALLREIENSTGGRKLISEMSAVDIAFLDGYLQSVQSFISQVKARQKEKK